MTSAVTSVVGRLPASQLFTLNAIIKHWKDLIDNTKTEEPTELYIKKLSLSLGRCILRPQYETELTIQDRTPGLFIADLLEHYDNVFPKLLEEKRNQKDRVMPVRKRTTLVDQRISRSSMSSNTNPQELLEQQRSLQHGTPQAAQAPPAEPPVPIPASSGPPIQPVPVPAPVSMTAPTAASTSSAAAAAPPPMASPPSSDEDGPPQQFVSPPDSPVGGPTTLPDVPESKVVPPTPVAERPSTPVRSGTPQARSSPSPASAGRTADDDTVVAPGSSGLKRNTSSETSRLRGPRGARGPRPPTGGHATRGSVTQLAAQFEQKQ